MHEPPKPDPKYANWQPYFGRYSVLRRLGSGAMGVVYLVQDEKLARLVAFKTLPDGLAQDAAAIEELRKEVKRGSLLKHPNVARTLYLEHSEEGAAIVMEFVDGQTLDQKLRAEPGGCFDIAEVFPWLGQIAAALDHVHEEARLAHRDLKPSNIMVSHEGWVKVTDFALASALSESHSQVSVRDDGAGTPQFMSPQQFSGEPGNRLDDIYSVGATIYALLTGKPPFHRGNVGQLYGQVMNAIPPPMAERRREFGVTDKAPIPAAWEETVAACLAKDAEERPQSAAEVLACLKNPSRSQPPAAPWERIPPRKPKPTAGTRAPIYVGLIVSLLVAALYELGLVLQFQFVRAGIFGSSPPAAVVDRAWQYPVFIFFAFAIAWTTVVLLRPSAKLVVPFMAFLQVFMASFILGIRGVSFSPFASAAAIALGYVGGIIRPGSGSRSGFSAATIKATSVIAFSFVVWVAIGELGVFVLLLSTSVKAHAPYTGQVSTPRPPAPTPRPAPPATSTLPPKPEPISQAKLNPPPVPPEDRLPELIGQGRVLRERGDVNTALTRFREASAIEPMNPAAIAEIAITYEKMSLTDKATEQWKRIYDMGDAVGSYFITAESRLKKSQNSPPEPAKNRAFTLSQQAILSLDDTQAARYYQPVFTATVTARRPQAKGGVELDILFPSTKGRDDTLMLTSNQGAGAKTLVGLEVGAYQAYSLKFTVLTVDGSDTASPNMTVGALIGPTADNRGFAYAPARIGLSSNRSAISNTGGFAPKTSVLGLDISLFGDRWPDGPHTMTVLVEPVEGATQLPR